MTQTMSLHPGSAMVGVGHVGLVIAAKLAKARPLPRGERPALAPRTRRRSQSRMTDPMIAVNSVNHQPPPAHALGRALHRPDGHPPRVVTIWKPMILVDRGFSSPEYGQDRNVSGAVVITSYGGGLGSGSRYAEHPISGKTQHEPGESTDRTATQSKHCVPSWTPTAALSFPQRGFRHRASSSFSSTW